MIVEILHMIFDLVIIVGGIYMIYQLIFKIKIVIVDRDDFTNESHERTYTITKKDD